MPRTSSDLLISIWAATTDSSVLVKVGNVEDIPIWRGLICVHAQEPVVKVYENWGFKVDKAMGTWYEEGIPHVAMFLRLKIPVKELKQRGKK
jgi:hypothetical protein